MALCPDFVVLGDGPHNLVQTKQVFSQMNYIPKLQIVLF